MKTTITIPLLPDARNHTHITCPKCGGSVRDASPGGVPGEVACNSCPWTAIWLCTTGELVGEPEPSAGIFEVNLSRHEQIVAAYHRLASIPEDTEIKLPGHGEKWTWESVDIETITGEESCNAWCKSHDRWQWTAGELVKTLREETYRSFISGFENQTNLQRADAEAQWTAWSNALSDQERIDVECGGYDSGTSEGERFNSDLA